MKQINLKRNQPEYIHHKELPHSASTHQLRFQPTHLPLKSERTTIFLNSNQLTQQLKHYQWRQKTQFPIVKVIDFYIKQSNEYQTELQVNHQKCCIILNQLKDLPLFKLLFLLKQSLIGFQRLFDRFGPFQITSKMVALNQSNKCKVWLNQNFSSNSFSKSFMSQKQFLNQIFLLYEERSNKLKNTSLFFGQLKKFTSFCQTLSFIQTYARENKISIPKICYISRSEKTSLQNEKSVKIFDPNLNMGRPLKFLNNNIRNSLKFQSKSAFKDVMQRYSQNTILLQENDYKNPEMKASGDTASGNSAKQTQNTKDSLVFQATTKEIKTKSFLPITNLQKKTIFSRKFSNQQYEINCLTPKYQKNDAAFLNYDQKEDNQVISQVLTATVFNKNNWQKTLNGLFQDDSGLKKSVHEGKQIRNLDVSTRNLKLLQSFGKELSQSCINGQ